MEAPNYSYHRSEEHTSELQSRSDLVCRLLLEKKKYTVLKDEKQWDEWKRQTIATIYAHGCENIISSSYNPITAEDILLFQEQQRYMFDVLTFILRTPMGKHFVRQHENTRDAQSVWRDYINHMNIDESRY